MKFIKLTQGKRVMVDDADFVFLSEHKWRSMKGHSTYYAVRHVIKADKKLRTIYMHRVILNTPEGLLTDHIDRNGLNNQRKNLRVATMGENLRNSKKRVDNVSGYKGLSWYNDVGKWRVQLSMGGKNVHIGYYTSTLSARKAYREARQKYYKEFA